MTGNLGSFLQIHRERDWVMDLLDEALIERYVRFRDTLSALDVERAERLVARSRAARKLVDFFRDFYAELDDLESHASRPGSSDARSAESA